MRGKVHFYHKTYETHQIKRQWYRFWHSTQQLFNPPYSVAFAKLRDDSGGPKRCYYLLMLLLFGHQTHSFGQYNW